VNTHSAQCASTNSGFFCNWPGLQVDSHLVEVLDGTQALWPGGLSPAIDPSQKPQRPRRHL